MQELERARMLLRELKFKEAAAVLDRLILGDSGNDELWYLRGVISLKMRNYDAAQDCFERALLLGRQSRYYQIKGMAHFELFEIEKAVEAFIEALEIEPDDPTTNFFLAICYLFLDDPRSDVHIRKARDLDGKKTKQLLLNFYSLFLKEDPRISDAQKRKIEERMKGLR
ncbi:MAG: tetratricopeptide repeat protein [Candidatus Micrarchaeota archaeon]